MSAPGQKRPAPCAHLDGNLCPKCLGDRCFVCLGSGSVNYYDTQIPCEECHGTGKDPTIKA